MANKENNKKIKLPHIFVLLLLLIMVSSFMTYVIPSGGFERIKNPYTGTTTVLANSYKVIESSPVPIWKIPIKFFEALTSQSTSQLIFFIVLIGGSFEIIMKTGSITSFFEALLIKFKNQKSLVIPVFVTLFSVFGFTMGLTTASIIFVPIGILAANLLGFGKITGTAMVVLGVNAGFAAGIYNPFTVGIAQTIAEVPLYSGAWMRWILLICLLICTTIYIIYYGRKYDSCNIQTIGKEKCIEYKGFLLREKLVLVVFFLGFIIVTYGIQVFKWKVKEISAFFLVNSIFCGFIYGFKSKDICDIFTTGCKKMVNGALIIGLAGTMRLILSEGKILDTIAFYLIGISNSLPNWAELMGMFYANAALNLLITSGSTKAAIVMPIMVPMADYLGLTRQSAVFAFQLGDGLLNLCSPLSTTLTGIMAVSQISYDKWIKFFFPLVGIYIVIGTILILLCRILGY